MPNILVGGDRVSSFRSTLNLLPYSGTLTPLSPQNQSGAYQFDHILGEPEIKRIMDFATSTGYIASVGRRQVASDFLFEGYLQWNPRYPVEAYLTLAANYQGFQLAYGLGTPSMYPIDIQVQQYYYCPSVFLEMGRAKVDTTGDRPKLIGFDFRITANWRPYFLPTDQAAVNSDIQYFQARGWSF